MSTGGTDERELQPLNSSSEGQQHDRCQPEQVAKADDESLGDKRSAAQCEEAIHANAAQQGPKDTEETEHSNSEVQCSASAA